MMSKPPSGFISATMATILEVPMSRPTMRLLLSLSLFIGSSRTSCTGRVSRAVVDGKTVGISQVDAFGLSRQTLQRTRVDRHESPELLLYLAAPQLQHSSIIELELPSSPIGQHNLDGTFAKGLQQGAEHQIALCHLGSSSIGCAEYRQSFVRGRFEQLTVGIHQRVVAPACERDMLLDLDVQARGPLAPH